MIRLAPPSRQRIAIIGSGIAGLTTAYLLHRDHELTIFEANDYVGGHTNTVRVERDDKHHAVDTGFIVFNERNYPNFTTLLRQLHVDTQPSSMSFSVRCDHTGVEYNGTSINGLFSQRRNLFRPRFHRMIRDIVRFNQESLVALQMADTDMTVEQFLAERRYGDAFVEHYLVPMGSSIWSCPPGAFRRFPLRFVIEFFNNHAMLQVGDRPKWRVVCGGSAQYVEKLTRGFRDAIRLRTPIRSIRREQDRVVVQPVDDIAQSFDHVIMACHSDQALRMLDDPTRDEREILGAIPYQRNDVLLHTDDRMMPRSRRAWASWNYHVRRDAPDDATITYNMNILQSLPSRETFCVTLNDGDHVDATRVIRRLTYEHPVFTSDRECAQRRHEDLINVNRTSYCGAYWGYGFHEDGVNSALAVCRAFGKSL